MPCKQMPDIRHSTFFDTVKFLYGVEWRQELENRIRENRERLGITQHELAEQSGVPRSTIAEIEEGIRTPGVDVAIKLADALGVRVEDLFIVF